ncbi:hypothetical protein MRX96_005557 [Rhipicephalus microplus]
MRAPSPEESRLTADRRGICTGIPVTSLYSCDRTRSTRLQATTDALFEELDNGNLSDVDGEFDESDDECVVPCAPDEDPVESDTESFDDESALNTSGSWRRKLFKAPDFFFFDNYFTSLPLLRVMLDCVVSADGNMAITRWRDSRTATLASNFIAIEDEDSVRRWNKAEMCYVDVKRPAAINAYNHSMGGVDKVDFLIALYRTTIRSRKWTLRMTFHEPRGGERLA